MMRRKHHGKTSERESTRVRLRRSVLPLAFSACLLGVPLTSSPSGAQSGNPAWPDNPLKGRILFEDKNCNQCHGIAGSAPGIGSDLAREERRETFLELGADLWNHVPGMSVRFQEARLPWPHLSADEVVELTAFLYFIDYLGRPGDADRGQRIFSEKSCATCHAIAGRGGEAGPDLSELKQFASPLYIAGAIWNHGPAMFESMTQRGMSPPTFNPGDLADLSAYVRRSGRPGPRERMLLAPGNPNSGEQVFRKKGCAVCHAIGDRSAGEAPDLAESELHQSAEAIAGAMWNHALAMSTSMRERGMTWPEFSSTELADLIAFLYFIPFLDPPGDVTRGAEIFARKSCADCHVSASNHPGPDLSRSGIAGSPATLVAAMWNHSPVMKEAILGEGRPWPELSGGDIRDLLAFLKQRSGVP